MEALQILITVLGVIGTVLTLLQVHRLIFLLVGLFRRKTWQPTENKHTYAICVPARNEEKVIGNFLESVANQDYPLDKLTVFVVADNCTDDTAAVARNFHDNGLRVVVYEHNDPAERTKGFALAYLFDKIKQDFGACCEGYFIFDADNVIADNYVTKMNEAFDAGHKIITSFRNSKNVNQNWISFSYAMHWMRTCLAENRGKGVLDQACRIQGTGFLFHRELVKDGWRYTTLTEDRSFCTDAVVQNYRITYCDEALFYDEQPYTLKVALRQRLRWSKGHLQSTLENCPKLLKNMWNPRKTFTTAYDCFWLNFPRSVEGGLRRALRLTLEMIVAIVSAEFVGWFGAVALAWLMGKASEWAGDLVIQLAVLLVYRGRIEQEPLYKRVFHLLMFPFFDVIGKWTSYLALFKKVEWKPIPHNTVMDLDKLKTDKK